MKKRAPIKFVLTKGVKEYRSTIPHYVNDEDVVLEIGCQWEATSAILDRHAKKVVGIDKGEALPSGREKHPHIRFERIDGFDIRAVLDLGLEFTKVYIGTSGCRDIVDVVKMARMYASALRPEVIVIKSTRLRGFVSNCIVWSGKQAKGDTT